MTFAAYVVRGTDAVLRDRVVADLVAELLGDDDRALALEETVVPGRATAGDDDGGAGTGAEGRDAAVAAVLNAASSPPFMTGCRVVVVRDAGALTAADVGPLVAYLDAPLDTTRLVFVAGGGTMPPALTKKLQQIQAEERAPDSEKTADVLRAAARDAGIRLAPDALQLVGTHLGDDAGRVAALVDVLAAAAADDRPLGADDVRPYLGGAGSVPPYQLTNALDAGDAPGALEVLHRLLTVTSPQQPRPMHPLQVMGLLANHYRRMLRLDDPAVRSEADAVAALGGKVRGFAARKALDGARALGTDGLRRAFDALEQADLDLKGARGIPEEAVMEVLVVRLARLAGRRPRPRVTARR